MPANYDQTSPYYATQYSQYFLDVMGNRPIPKLPDDQYFMINLIIGIDFPLFYLCLVHLFHGRNKKIKIGLCSFFQSLIFIFILLALGSVPP